jgi:CRISPR-associated protein Csh1
MIQECLEVFQRKLEKYGEAFVTDAYLPKDGTYRMIEIRENGFQILNTIEIRYDKKNGNLIGANEQDYIWFATWDYYSKLLEMNKPMDSSKTIHTNNYLSFAVKKESIQNQKLTNEIIANYYQILKNPKLKYQKKKNSQYLYERVEQKIGKPDTELIDRIAHYMLEDNRWTDIDLDKKDYVKIFFVFPDREKTKEYYQRENERYLVPNIYNSNDYNLTIENEIYGLPNNNMGLNGKKPYLENKTRKNPVPNLVNQEQALLQNQMFDYFWSQSSRGKNNIYINNEEENPDIKAYDNTKEPEFLQSGYYIRIKKDKNEVSVEQADVIVDYNPNLKRAFVLKYIF